MDGADGPDDGQAEAGAVVGGALFDPAERLDLRHGVSLERVVPPATLAVALGAAVAVGAVAGMYPALRAARLPPAEALRTG